MDLALFLFGGNLAAADRVSQSPERDVILGPMGRAVCTFEAPELGEWDEWLSTREIEYNDAVAKEIYSIDLPRLLDSLVALQKCVPAGLLRPFADRAFELLNALDEDERRAMIGMEKDVYTPETDLVRDIVRARTAADASRLNEPAPAADFEWPKD